MADPDTSAASGLGLPPRAAAGNRSLRIVIVGMAVIVAMLPFVASTYVLSLLVLAGIYAVLVIGLELFMGQTGQVSFGHNAFAVLGGYATAILTTTHNWPPLAALAFSIVISVIAALIIGARTLQLRGHYLAMATLALGMIAYTLTVQLTSLTNGFAGITGIAPLGIGPLELTSDLQYYYVVWTIAALGIWSSFRIKDSRVGRALGAIAGNEEAASALGINAARLKLTAFVISAAYAAVAGSLMAHFVGFLSPEVFGLDLVTLLFAMLFVGGIGTIYGPVVGAVLIALLPAILGPLAEYRQLAYGVILLAVIMFAPSGAFRQIVGLAERLFDGSSRGVKRG
ncbi:branched-chain amino acid ABC transporter permease [Bosea sp. (in: a-proteobacteria)]|uniref:branched-chain amino acid ABC transporter permease n=1 Tax=Bosea sp. (in: a-proteobacteria) TaxID=1871050 RepID=UPI00263555D4|nr:branched-chain amino acid ABC transporter permease [Bosea sp. (in: a-proteobacteria)]MCO5090928.1 branched-chain amino acid ABC transporter permease [Bosea sp. (in: a-proteobacteria)]